MKKIIFLSLCFAMFVMACGSKTTSVAEKPVEATVTTETKKENTVVRWNYGSSGNILVTIAEEKGYFDEVGITIKPVAATAVLNALGLLSANQVDIVSNAGTSNPLQQIAAYMNNSHYLVSADPLRNQVKRVWGILDKTGFLDENAKNIDIDEHINTSIYEEALKEAKSEYGSENPAFYEKMEKFFNENDR